MKTDRRPSRFATGDDCPLAHKQFEARVTEAPDATAIWCRDGTSLTYRELNHRANEVAGRLLRRGLTQEGIVAIALDRGPDVPATMLGVLKAGGAFLPLDLAAPSARTARILRDGRPQLIVTTKGAPLPDAIAEADVVELDGAVDVSLRNPDLDLLGDSLAYVIYTSGSTGYPKGALVLHRGLCAVAEGQAGLFGIGRGTRLAQLASLAYDASVSEIFTALLKGATLCVSAQEDLRPGPPLHATLKALSVSHLICPPSLAGILDPEELGSLQTIIAAGEVCPATVVTRWTDARRKVFNAYGPTETAICATSYRCLGPDRPPIGTPLAGVSIQLVDNDRRPVAEHTSGEIAIGGVGVGRGYLNAPELTALRFVPDPSSSVSGARMYCTGDLGQWRSDGQLEFIGRTDGQLKIRGYRVEVGEVEYALREHPDVVDAAVAPRLYPGDDTRLAAFVVRRPRPAAFASHDLPGGLHVFGMNRLETESIHREIFDERIYVQHGIRIGPNATVVDVGANIGLFALFAHAQADNVRVVAFEPIPAIADCLRANLAFHDVKADVFDVGLSNRSGTVPMTFYPRSTAMSGAYADPAVDRAVAGVAALAEGFPEPLLDNLLRDRFESITEERLVRTLSSMIEEHGIDTITLLKIDAEKAEFDVLAGIDAGDWRRIRQVVIEVHDEGGRLETIKELLRAHGFNAFSHQQKSLRGTTLHMVYAVHPERPEEPLVAPAAPAQPFRPAATPRQLQSFLSDYLPAYMMPSEFVFIDTIPRLVGGKVDRERLCVLASTPPPDAEASCADITADETIETTLALIWADVLNLPRVAPDDNFFDIGGHSLLAPEIIVRIQEAFGIEIPLGKLFECPTVASLSRELRREMPSSRSDARSAAVASASPSYSCLVAMRPGGRKRPTFWVHPAGGGISSYLDLCRHLADDRPFYGLQTRELAEAGESGERYASLEEMAAEYVRAVRSVQPHGPYLIGGWSFGGVVAFEMAVQLRVAGEHLAMVSLIDTYGPDIATMRKHDDGTLLFGLARERAQQTRLLLPVPFEDVQATPSEQRLDFVVDALRKARFLSPHTDAERIRHFIQGYRAREAHVRDYSPKIFDGQLTMFNAMEIDEQTIKIWSSQGLVHHEEARGWDRLSTQPVDIHRLPGTHVTIALEPHVAALAGKIHECVEAAEARFSLV